MTTPKLRMSRDELHTAETWIFDLDNTLYPAESNLFDQVDWNITAFVAEFLGMEPVAARKLQKQYFRDHGTTMKGLMVEHGVDPVEFLAYVHDIDLAPINENPTMEAALAKLPGRKIVFTNGSTPHAERITRHIGVHHHFHGFFDITDAEFTPKPARATYDAVCARYDIDPSGAVMVEDMARNLVPAAEMGMTTVWLDSDAEWARAESDGDHVHHVTRDLTAWLNEVVAGE